jgi:hypothetical protein
MYIESTFEEVAMAKLLLVVPILLGMALAGCADEEEALSTTTPPSGSPIATATATLADTGTPMATPTPSPTVTPVWQTYTNPTLGFSFQYPPSWSLQGYATEPQVRVASFDLTTWTRPVYPLDGIVVDIVRLPIEQAGPRPTDATDTMLGTLPGWARRPELTTDAPYEKLVIYAASFGDYTYSLSVAFQRGDTDESMVESIVASFALMK